MRLEKIFDIFMEIKLVSFFFIKLIRVMILFLFVNYLRYIYYRVGLRIKYGEVLMYALLLVRIGWVI